ncbi:hypothetical protein BDQ17DRAFT_1320749 [Cyathus striatus]|nr:hypothetical protein BDQ17DRAFT_1320749 [Cyathus striatus]
MKTYFVILPLTAALLSAASPIGNHAVFRRHTGVPDLGRRFIIQSRVDSPPACAEKAAAPSSTTVASAQSSISNTSNVDGSVPVTVSASIPSASTVPSSINTTVPADNSANTTNSTSTARRSTTFWSRIAQTDLPDVAQKWQGLCLASGGDIFTDEPCVVLAGLDGINALLADADSCAQQDVADAMIDFANSEGIVNQKELIAQAIVYRKHPRNSIEILGVTPSSLYCNRAPKNSELSGIVNDQLAGVDPGLFGSPNVPMVAFGADGTCPFGSSPDVSTCTCVQDSATADPVTGDSTDTSDSSDSTTDDASDSTAGGLTDDSGDSNDASTDDSNTDDSSGTLDGSLTNDTSDTSSTDDSDTSDDTVTSDSTSTSTGADPTATSYAEAVNSSDSDSADDSLSSTASVADGSSTADATSTDATSATSTTVALDPSESVFQPSDISGNVNDPDGR